MKQIALAAVVAFVAFGGCVAPEDQFYNKLYLCDAAKGDSECGTDRAGNPMTCYPGHLLGGADFCAETCNPDAPPNDAGFACIDAIGSNQPGALIQKCQPSKGAASCPNGLSCYRTDVLTDEGLCVTTRACSSDSDCGEGTIKKTCSSVYAAALGGTSLGFHADNLHCVQNTCSKGGTMCPPDEGCLFDFYAAGETLPDICVPRCDRGKCPPNFSCVLQSHAPGAPNLCVPGIAGTTCTKNQDCLIGQCLDTGGGFSVCALPLSCADNDYCGHLDQPTDKFICAEGIPGQAICVNLRPYAGGNCKLPTECPPGQECMFYSATSTVLQHGDCRVPCTEDGHCEKRGGVPYVCVGAMQEGGCHPSDFGLPCSSDSDCLEGLSCVTAGPDERSLHNYSPKVCTIPCTVDGDCDANRLTGHGGFCEEDAGICRRRGHGGSPCSRGPQCYSNRCDAKDGCAE